MLSLEYFVMSMVCFGLFVGYCYAWVDRLIDDIGVSVITDLSLGINYVIKLVRCHRTGLSPVQPHLPLWEGPNWVYCRASRRYLPRVKVMGARYPDQVGGHKPCVLIIVVWILVRVWDRLCFATTVAVGVFGKHGATQD